MSRAPHSPRDDQQPPLPVVWLDLVTDESSSDEHARAVLGRDPTGTELAALAAARGHLLALGALSRLDVPESLEGLVVASLEAGHRQDRAAAVLGSLERRTPPASLDAVIAKAVERSTSERRIDSSLSAPRVLDRLVEERIATPDAGMVRSMAGRLDRRSAPGALDERVLQEGAFAMRGSRRRASAVRVFGAAAVAAALILVTRLSPGSESTPVQVEEPSGPILTMVRVDSLDDLSLSDRALLSSMTGEIIGGRS